MIRRWAFNLAAAMSLLLCAATVVLWVRSYWMYDIASIPLPNSRGLQIDEVRGRFVVTIHLASPAPIESDLELSRISDVETYFPPSESTDRMLYPPTFQWHYMNASHGGKVIKFCMIGFPHWLIVLLLAWPIEIMLARRVRFWLRVRNRRCVACGYNLTGNASGVCPECGTRFESRVGGVA